MARRAVPIVLGLFFAAFFFVPLVNLVIRGISDIGGSGGVSAPGIVRTALITAGQAGLSALLAVVFAIPGAYALSHFEFRAKSAFQSLFLLPFVLPSVIVIICMISFYGRSGVLNTLMGTKMNLVYSFGGILIAHVFYNFAVALRVIADGWRMIPARYGEVAQSLGDTRVTAFIRCELPLLLPSILTAFALVFVYCFMSFGIVLVFGGVRYATLEVRIYQELFQRLNYPRGSLLALVQLAISVLFLWLSSILSKNTGKRETATRATVDLKSRKTPIRIAVSAYWALAVLFLLGPIGSMLVSSAKGSDGRLFLGYAEILGIIESSRNIPGLMRSTIGGVIIRSIAIAVASGTITFSAAFAAALTLRQRATSRWHTLFQSPMGMTVVGLAVGLRLLFGDAVPALLLTVVGQFFIGFPFVFRISSTVASELDEGVIECAHSLGARRWQTVRTVVFPALRKGLLNAYAFAVALAFADFTMVLTMSGGRVVTFPVAIFRLIGFRSFDVALALSGIYIAFCLILFLVIQRTSAREVV